MTIECQTFKSAHSPKSSMYAPKFHIHSMCFKTITLKKKKKSHFEFYLQEISTYVTNSSLELSYVFYIMEAKYF